MLQFQSILIFSTIWLSDAISSEIHMVPGTNEIEYAVNERGDDMRVRINSANNNPEGTYANALRGAGRWPAKNNREYTVPYDLAPEISSNSRKRTDIRAAIREFDRKTCIRFVPRRNEQDYVHIMDDGFNNCYSFVGRVGGKQDLSLGDGCVANGTRSYTGVAMHELMHALGFLHEHSRFDRDQYITINRNNVDPNSQENFNLFNSDQADTFGLPYDYNSIMHYGRKYGSVQNPSTGFASGDTIVPLDPSATIGQRSGFSDCDLNKINTLYPCSNRKLNNKCVAPELSACTGNFYSGARLPFIRMFSSAKNDHFYTTNAGEVNQKSRDGYLQEGTEGSLALSQSDINCPCLRPLYRLRKEISRNNNVQVDHFYAISESERNKAVREGYNFEGIEGYCTASPTCGATLPLKRSYNVRGFDHFYSVNSNRPAGYKDEGTECYMWA